MTNEANQAQRGVPLTPHRSFDAAIATPDFFAEILLISSPSCDRRVSADDGHVC